MAATQQTERTKVPKMIMPDNKVWGDLSTSEKIDVINMNEWWRGEMKKNENRPKTREEELRNFNYYYKNMR